MTNNQGTAPLLVAPTYPLERNRTLCDVEQFLFEEADYMDNHEYGSWLQLWSDEVEYWVPGHPDDDSPHLRVAIIYDDRARLEERLQRWTGGYAHAQIPRPALSRVVSNIRIAAETADELIVTSRFMLTLLKPGGGLPRTPNEMVFAGRSVHKLSRAESVDGRPFLMTQKTVRLLNAHLPLPNIQFLL